MDNSKTYLIREAMVAVRPAGESGVRIVTIPHGSVIELPDSSKVTGLVDIRWQGRDFAVFMQDLESRGAIVHAVHA